MAVNLAPPKALLPVPGVRIGVVSAGIRYPDRRDLVLFQLAEGSQVAGVFTTNAFCAAPVQVAKRHLQANTPRAWLVNTGTANAGTGERGIQAALESCAMAAEHLGVDAEQVLPFSTGVIGEHLPMERMRSGIQSAAADLAPDEWLPAAEGIMTTDTMPKGASLQLTLDGQNVTLTGIAKGAGMIRPDMATMLAFIATDAAIAADDLQAMLQTAVRETFNAVTVDGDTSTNDACVIAATGQSGVRVDDGHGNAFQAALNRLCTTLAESLIRDAEGATKLITIDVSAAIDADEARAVAFTIAHSPLVKTAFFASDPNWGRILAAIGRVGLSDFDADVVELALDDLVIARNGCVAEDYDEAAAQAIMNQAEIRLRVNLQRGGASASVKTCDLGYDYVRINADYRS